jgi:hypothetical protein
MWFEIAGQQQLLEFAGVHCCCGECGPIAGQT